MTSPEAKNREPESCLKSLAAVVIAPWPSGWRPEDKPGKEKASSSRQETVEHRPLYLAACGFAYPSPKSAGSKPRRCLSRSERLHVLPVDPGLPAREQTIKCNRRTQATRKNIRTEGARMENPANHSGKEILRTPHLRNYDRASTGQPSFTSSSPDPRTFPLVAQRPR